MKKGLDTAPSPQPELRAALSEAAGAAEQSGRKTKVKALFARWRRDCDFPLETEIARR